MALEARSGLSRDFQGYEIYPRIKRIFYAPSLTKSDRALILMVLVEQAAQQPGSSVRHPEIVVDKIQQEYALNQLTITTRAFTSETALFNHHALCAILNDASALGGEKQMANKQLNILTGLIADAPATDLTPRARIDLSLSLTR